jgi:hypothetical protein
MNNYIILNRENDIVGILYTGVRADHENLPTKVVRGKVNAVSGDPLSGVSVTAKGTQTGTSTDSRGNFALSVNDNTTVLVFSHVGFQTIEHTLLGEEIISIVMQPDAKSLGDIVVVGYGQVKKNDLTGSVSSIPVKEIKKVVSTSLDQALQGRAAGVQITQNSGAPGGTTTIRIRGGNSIQGDNEPLYVIDGVPFQKRWRIKWCKLQRVKYIKPQRN